MKRMLPLAAALMMGTFSKQSGAASTSALAGASGGGIATMLGSLLDQNRDGSIADDVTSLFGRFIGRS